MLSCLLYNNQPSNIIKEMKLANISILDRDQDFQINVKMYIYIPAVL